MFNVRLTVFYLSGFTSIRTYQKISFLKLNNVPARSMMTCGVGGDAANGIVRATRRSMLYVSVML